MRHRVAGRRLGRNPSHRRAMRRALVVSLFRHESITTTTAKAKDVRSMAERLITRAKKGGLANYRRALADLQDKVVVKKLFNEIAPRYEGRPGGYTRILRLSERRLNDAAEQVVFELVGEEQRADRHKAPKKPKLTARRKRKLEQDERAKEKADKQAEADQPAVESEAEPDEDEEGPTPDDADDAAEPEESEESG